MVSSPAWNKVFLPRFHSGDASLYRREACGRWRVSRYDSLGVAFFSLRVFSVVLSCRTDNVVVRLDSTTLLPTKEVWPASASSGSK